MLITIFKKLPYNKIIVSESIEWLDVIASCRADVYVKNK